jgi:hypothetical protein
VWLGLGGGSNPILIDDGIQPDFDYRGVNIQTGPAPAGRVYACWTMREDDQAEQAAIPRKIGFRYSTDGGVTWNSPTGGQLIESLTGFKALPGKTMRTYMFPSMTVDQSTGHIYIVYADKPSTDADVYLKKSTDGGLNWGAPIRVNQDAAGNGKDQWHPWITWDDCTGAIAVLFYDSRNSAGNDRVNSYVAVTYNGGSTWQEFKASDADWDGDAADGFAGDYLGLAARDGMAFPVWSDDRPPRANDQFRPYISPFYLWGVFQSSVSETVVVQPDEKIDVAVSWTTNLAATGDDVLVLRSPSGITYTETCSTCNSNGGLNHTVAAGAPCEPGWWKYTVKSTRPGFTKRGSDEKKFFVNCID